MTQALRDWPLDVVTVRYSYSYDTEVLRWGDSLLSNDFSGELPIPGKHDQC